MSCVENDSYVLKLGNTEEDVYYAIEGQVLSHWQLSLILKIAFLLTAVPLF